MDQVSLPLQKRAEGSAAKQLRAQNVIPAVVYGHGFENLHLQVDYQTFRRAFEKATYSTIINLEIDGAAPLPVLVHDVQYHPVSDKIEHVDFYKVNMNEKVETHVALQFVGESPAVRAGGMLNVTKNQLQIECLPMDLVHHIEVDISSLKEIGDIIHVSDIVAPKGITILDAPEDGVASAIELRVTEEEPTTTEGDAAGSDADKAKEESSEKKGE